jgi:hypothetical protein
MLRTGLVSSETSCQSRQSLFYAVASRPYTGKRFEKALPCLVINNTWSNNRGIHEVGGIARSAYRSEVTALPDSSYFAINRFS